MSGSEPKLLRRDMAEPLPSIPSPGSFVARFRGVRGSHPSPGEHTLRIGGNTSCVEVWAGGHLIILDAGTGIIKLGEDLLVHQQRDPHNPIVASVFLTHTHHDHTQGFPFFRPAYLAANTVYMFGPRQFAEELEDVLAKAMLSPYFPVEFKDMKSMKFVRSIEENMVVVLNKESKAPQVRHLHRDDMDIPPDHVKITTYRSYAHPKNGSMVYRVEWRGRALVYATDTESYVGGDQRLIKFARKADVLIHDAQYRHEDYVALPVPKQGWGHSTPEMAVAVAKGAQVGHLVLFHHEPQYNDETILEMERAAQQQFPTAFSAYEGLEVELQPDPLL